jgi:hypothetical protein
LRQPFLYLTLLIGITTSIADIFAATTHHGGFIRNNRQRQTANRALSQIADIVLREQLFIMQLSLSFLTSFLMLILMIFLTLNGAIFNKVAVITKLQCDVINCGDATRSAYFYFICCLQLLYFICAHRTTTSL